ncbi:probable n-acetyltransferase hls1-like [Phtheirospermum japonicum]|uniref:Probable n-acetyltransferase hls1-like n=1 Tax=Phtheirospermum japonicum TaxID=374723 RepID=A0A830C1Q8_9LAMI|nr:probable n-acetyltransferase hls1-like [Phtheirospermum japonicum]
MAAVVVREYDAKEDCGAVEQMENRCEVGPSNKLTLYTDLLGDPICRVRNSPAYLMLVAEMVGGGGEDREIVGTVRGCIKTVTCGTKLARNIGNNSNCITKQHEPLPIYTKLAYILGLRVSQSHRRMGIGLKLVQKMEAWFRDNGAEYSYMATENDNRASVNLFTHKCGYSKFRTPSILVRPVFATGPARQAGHHHQARAADAESLYRRRFSTTEFFPRDIDAVLSNALNLGTFLAVPSGSYHAASWPGADEFLASRPESWALLSVWNCKDVYRLEVRGASRVRKGLAKATRVVDRALPWLHLPSVPQIFRPFGFLFLYGLGGEGPYAGMFMKALCDLAHNLAKERGCEVVAAEVAMREPLRLGIPHWKSLSCAEDLWCIKRLGEDYSDGSVGDWTKSPPGLSIFVDPREV